MAQANAMQAKSIALVVLLDCMGKSVLDARSEGHVERREGIISHEKPTIGPG
jgi:hypothetical protein